MQIFYAGNVIYAFFGSFMALAPQDGLKCPLKRIDGSKDEKRKSAR